MSNDVVMRAKMRVGRVEASETCERVSFSAVCKNEGYPSDGTDENNSFALWTPQADLSMVISNPALFGELVEGQEFYVDFTKAE